MIAIIVVQYEKDFDSNLVTTKKKGGARWLEQTEGTFRTFLLSSFTSFFLVEHL